MLTGSLSYHSSVVKVPSLEQCSRRSTATSLYPERQNRRLTEAASQHSTVPPRMLSVLALVSSTPVLNTQGTECRISYHISTPVSRSGVHFADILRPRRLLARPNPPVTQLWQVTTSTMACQIARELRSTAHLLRLPPGPGVVIPRDSGTLPGSRRNERQIYHSVPRVSNRKEYFAKEST